MNPEEQNNEPENNAPEDPGQSSSNTYPGQWSNDKAQKLYNLSQTPQKIKNFKKRTKKLKGAAKKIATNTARTVKNTAQAARTAYAAAQATYAITSIIASLISLKVIIIIIIVIVIIFGLLKTLDVLGLNTSSNQQITVSGPIWAKIGDKLDYAITVNYPGTAQDIIITDQIPAGTEYVNAPNATYNPTTNTVTWNITPSTASTSGSLDDSTNTTLSLTLLATKDNDYIVNLVKGIIQGGVLGINDSKLHTQLSPTTYSLSPNTPNTTPTVFQLAPTNIPISPQDTNAIKSCVVTKVGEPEVIPSLPPECTTF